MLTLFCQQKLGFQLQMQRFAFGGRERKAGCAVQKIAEYFTTLHDLTLYRRFVQSIICAIARNIHRNAQTISYVAQIIRSPPPNC